MNDRRSGERPACAMGASRRRWSSVGSAFTARWRFLIAAFSTLSPAFFTFSNGINILQQTSTIGIMAIGETLVILAGGIDVSVGSVLGLGGMIAAMIMRHPGADPVVSRACRNRGRAAGRPDQRGHHHAAAHRPVHYHARLR